MNAGFAVKRNSVNTVSNDDKKRTKKREYNSYVAKSPNSPVFLAELALAQAPSPAVLAVQRGDLLHGSVCDEQAVAAQFAMLVSPVQAAGRLEAVGACLPGQGQVLLQQEAAVEAAAILDHTVLQAHVEKQIASTTLFHYVFTKRYQLSRNLFRKKIKDLTIAVFVVARAVCQLLQAMSVSLQPMLD